MPSPTPRGILPPPIDMVPVPDYIREQTAPALFLESTDTSKKKTFEVKRKGSKPLDVNSIAYIYAKGYRRGWADSAAHYFIEEELKEEAT